MQLSVIILNYNVRYFLELCVMSVQKALHGLDAEIIVVDNASYDESRSVIKERFPEVIWIQNAINEGFPKGNNMGVAHAQGEYVCILNPDTLVAEDTFLKILDFLENTPDSLPKLRDPIPHSELGILGCRLFDGTGRFLPESKRGVPTPWVAFTKIIGLYKVFPKWKWMNRYYAQSVDEHTNGAVEILVGAMMVMKRSFYLDLKGFDEACFMYSDDIDLSYRSLLEGKQNIYFSETSVLHFKGESTSKDVTYLNHFRRAMEYFYQKHFTSSRWFSVFLKLGAFVFSFLKLIKSKKIKVTLPDAIILVSDSIQNPDFILRNYPHANSIHVVEKITDNLSDLIVKAKKVQIIFDIQSVTFREAFGYMNSNNSSKLTFRFLHPDREFMLGSDSSFERGEVTVFESK